MSLGLNPLAEFDDAFCELDGAEIIELALEVWIKGLESIPNGGARRDASGRGLKHDMPARSDRRLGRGCWVLWRDASRVRSPCPCGLGGPATARRPAPMPVPWFLFVVGFRQRFIAACQSAGAGGVQLRQPEPNSRHHGPAEVSVVQRLGHNR